MPPAWFSPLDRVAGGRFGPTGARCRDAHWGRRGRHQTGVIPVLGSAGKRRVTNAGIRGPVAGRRVSQDAVTDRQGHGGHGQVGQSAPLAAAHGPGGTTGGAAAWPVAEIKGVPFLTATTLVEPGGGWRGQGGGQDKAQRGGEELIHSELSSVKTAAPGSEKRGWICEFRGQKARFFRTSKAGGHLRDAGVCAKFCCKFSRQWGTLTARQDGFFPATAQPAKQNG